MWCRAGYGRCGHRDAYDETRPDPRNVRRYEGGGRIVLRMTTATGITYTVLGTTDEVTECGICGKVELKGTMVLDVDGTAVYAGFTCGARLAGRPVKEFRTEAARADRAAVEARRAAEQAERDARDAAEHAAFSAWVLDRYGLVIAQTSDLWDHVKVTGKRPFQITQEWRAEMAA